MGNPNWSKLAKGNQTNRKQNLFQTMWIKWNVNERTEPKTHKATHSNCGKYKEASWI
jgi:hypothetical protein